MFSIKNTGRILGNNKGAFSIISTQPKQIIKEEEEEKPKRRFYQK
jgi:hypothetical protein